MLEYNNNTFGNVSIGIHGKELPKFAQGGKVTRNPDTKKGKSVDDLREWWKVDEKHDPAPK